jgi:PAS domain S-box-containing protein
MSEGSSIEPDPVHLHAMRNGMPNYTATFSSRATHGPVSVGRDLQSLIDHTCEQLVGQLGVFNIWLVLRNGEKISSMASSFPRGFQPLHDRLRDGFCPNCLSKALAQEEVVLVAHPPSECGDCPLANSYHGRVGMAVRIAQEGRVFGVFCASIPDVLVDDAELRRQVKQAACDVARELTLFDQREEMIKSDELVHSIFRVAPVGIGLLRGDVICEANETLGTISGYAREELVGMPFEQLFYSTEDVARMKKWLEVAMDRSSGAATEICWKNRAGLPVDVRISVTPLDLSDPSRGVTFSVLDVSKEKERENQVREGRRLLASLMDSLPGMAYRCKLDTDWTMEFVSKGCLELTGYEPNALLGNRDLSFASLIHPDDRERVQLEISGTPVAQPFTLEYRINRASGEERWVWERGKKISGSSSEAEMVEGFIIDVTERKRLDEHIIQLKKAESLGVMAGGVAHDFNNILAIIMGNSEMAIDAAGDRPDVRSCLNQIMAAGEKAATLCRKLLYFCGSNRVVESCVDINRMIQEVLPLLRSMIAPDVRFNVESGEDLPPIKADPTEVRQVLMQLIINSAESYGGKPGVVEVASGSAYLDGKRLPHHAAGESSISGWCAWIKVSDRGCGMDDNVRARMFDPFFSTKFTGRGMGLAAVQGIIASLNGCITVASKPGRGTSITAYFPVTDAAARVGFGAPVKPVTVSSAPPAQTVLVVDDDPTLLSLTRTMLERENIRVVSAVDGLDACERFLRHRDEIDLVLMDLTMPRLDGIGAAQRMLAERKDLRIVFTTGYSEDDITRRIDPALIEGILLKPYTRDDLLRYVNRPRPVA